MYTNTFANETDVRPLLLILVIRLARSKTDLKCILKTAVPSKNTFLLAMHNIAKVTTAELLSDVKVIGYSFDKRYLIFLESILIKNLTPTINSQKEGCDSLLKFFKH